MYKPPGLAPHIVKRQQSKLLDACSPQPFSQVKPNFSSHHRQCHSLGCEPKLTINLFHHDSDGSITITRCSLFQPWWPSNPNQILTIALLYHKMYFFFNGDLQFGKAQGNAVFLLIGTSDQILWDLQESIDKLNSEDSNQQSGSTPALLLVLHESACRSCIPSYPRSWILEDAWTWTPSE